MFAEQSKFWNEWAEAYQRFSETIEPYREAQHTLAHSLVTALGEDVNRETLYLLDVGGGTGNMIRPILEALNAQRGYLKGITYVLTDGANMMVTLANKRVNEFKKLYCDVEFRVIQADTLSDDFVKRIGYQVADVVFSSWNVEYYSTKTRQQIVTKLVQLASDHGVVAFSSVMKLPAELSIRDVLMPLGSAQVVHALLAGNLRRMRKVINGLKQIANFGVAASNSQFPAKPNIAELKELAQQADLASAQAEYHLYGASGMIVARKDIIPTPKLAKPPIVQVLVGKEGYINHLETITFWNYLHQLMRNQQPLN